MLARQILISTFFDISAAIENHLIDVLALHNPTLPCRPGSASCHSHHFPLQFAPLQVPEEFLFQWLNGKPVTRGFHYARQVRHCPRNGKRVTNDLMPLCLAWEGVVLANRPLASPETGLLSFCIKPAAGG